MAGLALEDIVRCERGRVLGALTRAFANIDIAEEAFQAAVLAALESWPPVPENPGAWLTAAAKNHARDVLRHNRVVDAHAPLLAGEEMTTDTPESVRDDQLRLIFTCCHPALGDEWQIALTLKVVCGFETADLARAFLCPEATVAQRIVRAKRLIEDKGLPYVVPDHKALPARLNTVLAVVYQIFNAGYTSREGALIRVDLQAEALRLGRLLGDLLPQSAEVFGLIAMMAFAASRAATRTDAEGRLLLLAEQDRAAWNRALIREGLFALQRARALPEASTYWLQAEIGACHATAPSWQETDWVAILTHYDTLLALSGSPVVALNRAVAVCMRDGAEAALQAIAPLEPQLANYHLYYSTRADFTRRAGRDARADYERALALATNESERAFLRARLDG